MKKPKIKVYKVYHGWVVDCPCCGWRSRDWFMFESAVGIANEHAKEAHPRPWSLVAS